MSFNPRHIPAEHSPGQINGVNTSTFNSEGSAPDVYPSPVQQQLSTPPVSGIGFGITALVLGIVAIVLSFMPLTGVVAFVPGPLAILFGIIGATRKFAKKGAAIAGLVLGVLSIVVAAIWLAVIATAVDSTVKALNSEHKVEYVVTTNGTASVSYSTTDGGTSNEDVTAEWKKEQTVKKFEFLILTVTGDFSNADAAVGCEILFDGKPIAKNSGTGLGAKASCSGSGLASSGK